MKRVFPYIFAVLLALLVARAAAQERIYVEAALSTWDGQDIPEELYGFRSVPEAENALVCILNEAGLNPNNFRIAAANVPNAAAATLPSGCGNVTVPCERALLYNPTFMQEMLDSTGNKWSSISVLAHEVGHHLEAHTIRPGGSNPPDELEADEYSGFVLRKLGASLADTQAVFRTFSSGGSDTHPPRDARLTAVANGWTRANRTGDGDTSCLGIGTTTGGGTAAGRPNCEGQAEGAECWKALVSHPGCRVWDDHYNADQTGTWTGECAGGLASGTGTLTWVRDGKENKWSGLLRDGKHHGHWVIRNADGSVAEGPYVDSKMHSRWFFRFADGSVAEGPYVDGKMQGHWVIRNAGRTVLEGPMVDDKKQGHWVERAADGNVHEGPYVDGKRQGRWVERQPNGAVWEGPMVADEKHGPWVSRNKDGTTHVNTWVRGELQRQ